MKVYGELREKPSTWVGQPLHLYSVSSLPSLPVSLAKCMLTIDDVMLQVQLIYVNRGSGGREEGQTLPGSADLFTHKMKAIMQHLRDCTDEARDPMVDVVNQETQDRCNTSRQAQS